MTTRKDLYEFLRDSKLNKNISDMFKTEARDLIVQTFEITEERACNFLKSLKMKWTSVHYDQNKMLEKYGSWLEQSITVDVVDSADNKTVAVVGRPKLGFDESSTRTKKRRSEELSTEKTLNELLSAAIVLLKKFGRVQDAKIVSKILSQSEDGSCSIKSTSKYSPPAFVALILDCRLSRQDFQTIREGAKRRNVDLYPAYNHVLKAKDDCIPSKGITATDYTAAVDLQDLVDHTARRIIEACDLTCPDFSTVTMTHKVGFDGSTGQSVYKQTTSEDCDRESISTEESLFLTCLVPLDMKIKNDEIKNLWINERPSSTLLCRPIRFRYIKESIPVLLEEMNYFKQIELHPTQIGTVVVEHKLEVTMIDGKVATALSEATNSSQCCSICGLNPKRMNNISYAEDISKDLLPVSFQYGLSTLHAWIRCMECILHISYKLEINNWQARSVEQKEAVKVKRLRC